MRIYKQIEKLVQSNKLSHLYIINTQKVANTKKEILKLINAINSSDLKIDEYINYELDNIFPNIFYLDGNSNKIKKEDLNYFFERLNLSSLMDPYQYKVGIIENLESTSLEGLNSILKEIEEPGENISIFIFSNNIKKLLPTILSRAQIVTLDEEDLSEVYKEFDSHFDAFVEVCVLFSNNNISRAKEFSNKSYNEIFDKYVKIMQNAYKKQNFFYSLYVSLNEDLEKDKQERNIFILNLIKYSIIGVNETNNFYIHNNYFKELNKISNFILKEQIHLTKWINYINDFLQNIELFGNFKIQKQDMLLKMGEIYE
ncbi:DNA polymerase III subunit delta [Mycoplasmopsis canis]|uniref:DNA polymerase III subunit delta n=1 Tax=Mycoplasmopsis canis TaxID=29555 RepID=UPI00025B0006|nr:DNA polymerase III subunit delta [Mycoplasmopsis canis]EIE39292.1 DNA polymerase iii subunit delta [Mycoplasmopsis canis UF33]